MRSKKSNTSAWLASCSTPSGVSSSTASGTVATLPLRLEVMPLAMRSTVVTSATSDSTAATISPVEVRSSRTMRSTRLRDSARAGNTSSASNAAVSRRPWPSSCPV